MLILFEKKNNYLKLIQKLHYENTSFCLYLALKSWRYSSKIYARPVVRGGVARAPLSPPKIGGTGDTLSKTKMKKMKKK